MIEITSAVHQDKVIDLLNNYNEDGVEFSYKEKKGINLYFETNMEDLESASKLAKKVIKSEPWGTVLFFRVSPVE
ncbi:hypothetical protein [Paraliobacillus salinarum]|uniref:hypothetical protein n=1 Tax=Paraliobacillus salinarum TaxID=1158996 RepID=UPI0015F76F40|nr:hypothetical protein [Paraliobacillus salinarum]